MKFLPFHCFLIEVFYNPHCLDDNQWFQKYVCYAESINLLDRLGNKFEGEKEITRAEVVDWVGKISP